MQGRVRLVPSFTVTSPGWEENDWPALTVWTTSQRRNMTGLSLVVESWAESWGGLGYMAPDYTALARAVITHSYTISVM